jgi:hypothetical protein
MIMITFTDTMYDNYNHRYEKEHNHHHLYDPRLWLVITITMYGCYFHHHYDVWLLFSSSIT